MMAPTMLINKQEGELGDRVSRILTDLSIIDSRKSYQSQVQTESGSVPLTCLPEVIEQANKELAGKGIPLENGDVPKTDSRQREIYGWERYNVREKVATQFTERFGGRPPHEYLPGRFLHHSLLADKLISPFNGNGNGKLENISIAELGCQTLLAPIISSKEKGVRVTGVDISIMGLEYARYLSEIYGIKDKVGLVRGDFYATPLTSGSFDLVAAIAIVEHLDEEQSHQLVQEMVRVAKPGGYVVLAIPNLDSPFYKRLKTIEESVYRKFKEFVRFPWEKNRKKVDIEKLMKDESLIVVEVDGIHIAPPYSITRRDFLLPEDVHFFNHTLVRTTLQTNEDKTRYWRVYEPSVPQDIKMRYGGTIVAIGQKPAVTPEKIA